MTRSDGSMSGRQAAKMARNAAENERWGSAPRTPDGRGSRAKSDGPAGQRIEVVMKRAFTGENFTKTITWSPGDRVPAGYKVSAWNGKLVPKTSSSGRGRGEQRGGRVGGKDKGKTGTGTKGSRTGRGNGMGGAKGKGKSK